MKHISLLLVLLLSCLWYQASAQDRTVSGRVTDRTTGQGLPGVGVIVKGTTIGTSTNSEGTYTLSVPASATTLSFQFIGYTSVERPATDGTINVSLSPDGKQLGEVVVTGALGIQRQAREVGYATATLDTKELTQARVNNVTNGLVGKVSGLQVQTVGSGVNPQVRVTLRGTRSLTGNNEALIVIDGIISTNEALVALNPDDISDISVLKGANAAALYGSQASNGALIITTKKGSNTSQVTLSHTSQLESISFLPGLQSEFGPGATNWGNSIPQFPLGDATDDELFAYNSMENQQFGPRFDGSIQNFGEKLADGSLQKIAYVARPDEKKKFWNTGYQVQNGVTFSGGDEKTKFYASYQNVHNNGVVPKDQYDRNTFRINASREIGRLTVGFNLSYAQQKVDQTLSPTGDSRYSVYYTWFNTSAMAPLTEYKDWKSNKFADPNGYYNAYYLNPYYVIDNNRYVDRRNTVLGNIDLSYRITDWLRLQYRLGTTNIDQSGLYTQEKFTYNSYILSTPSPTFKAGTAIPGLVQDISSYQRRINSDAFVSMDKTFGDFNVKAIVGNNVQQFQSHYNNVASTALAVPGLFNLSNRVGQLTGGNASYTTRIYAFYADVTLGYKDFLFVHGSGRNDNISFLDPSNRSYFYPGVDASFVFTNAVPALKDVSWLDYGKLRGGYTKVSLVNLGGAATTFGAQTGVAASNGAYRTTQVFNPGTNFPFGSNFSYTVGNALVFPGLTPETTYSTEVGLELSFFKRRVAGAVSYYSQQSKGQTLNTDVSYTTGFSSLLLNAGEVTNQGIEADLNITPVRTESGLVITLGGNFNYNNNNVVSLPTGVNQINLSTGGNSQLIAIPGQPYPVLTGSHYARTDNGRVKLNQTSDPFTGEVLYYPVKASDNQIFGNTQPKYKYGFNASISYKGVTLAGQGELRTNYFIYNSIGEDLDFTGSGSRSVMYGRQNFVYPNSAYSTDNGVTYIANEGAQAVKTPGDAEFWAQNSTWNRTVAENYVTSGTFFKIRELTLSYALPAAILTRTGFVKGLSLNVYGRNIYTWVPKENIYTDPEFSFSNSNAIGINNYQQTPPTKFYGASLNATF